MTNQDNSIMKYQSAVQPDCHHSVKCEEERLFVRFLNQKLEGNAELNGILPIKDGELYQKVQDGWIISCLINHVQENTIDLRILAKNCNNDISKLVNMTVALNSAIAIGIRVVNIGPADLCNGTPHLVIAFLWRLVKAIVLAPIALQTVTNFEILLEEGEDPDSLKNITSQEILIRWVNFHLRKAGSSRKITNFSSDITDSEVYTKLIYEIAPSGCGVNMDALTVQDPIERAKMMLAQAKKIGCDHFLTVEAVVTGKSDANLAFVANMYNTYAHLVAPEEIVVQTPVEGETREERMYRNFINSLCLPCDFVQNLFADINDGSVLTELLKEINQNPNNIAQPKSKKMNMIAKIEKLNKAIETGKQMGFSLIGIDGKNLFDGDKLRVLALMWQALRYHTVAVLSKAGGGHAVTDGDILKWANEKLANTKNPVVLKSFKDKSLCNGRIILDLLNTIKPGTFNESLFQSGDDSASYMANSVLAISLARKIGAVVYALPEDIVEGNGKMVMTIFALLMTIDTAQ